ncbi:MAG TPA: phage tail terminator-like protein [Promineifilum sp.]|nr:phage tail terminator-like protein [Promineifilum sp.]
MIEGDIVKALQTAVGAAVQASIIPAMPIKAIGRTLPNPQPDRYVEIVHVPNNRQNEYWGSERTYQGSLRVIVHWPVNDEGVMPGSRFLDSIAAYFTKGRTLVSGSAKVVIYDVPDATGCLEAGGGLLFPLVIPYRCFAT